MNSSIAIDNEISPLEFLFSTTEVKKQERPMENPQNILAIATHMLEANQRTIKRI